MFGNVLSQVTPPTSDFPSGRTTTYAYTTGAEIAVGGAGTMPARLQKSVTDPNGKVSTYSYDAKGDIRRVVDPLLLQTDFSYDNLGRKLTSVETSDSFPAGLTTTWTYDELNSVLTETQPTTNDPLNGAGRQRRVSYAYDANENVKTETVSDVIGNDPSRTTTYEYDSNDRVFQIQNAAGLTELSYQSGVLQSVTEPNGAQTYFDYSVRLQLTATSVAGVVDDPTNPTAPHDVVIESRTYDDAGRLSVVSDAIGREVQYQYTNDDMLAGIVQVGFHNPNGTTRNIQLQALTYDGAGNVVREVSGGGLQRIDYAYDAAGRRTSQTLDPLGLNRVTTFGYDANSNVTRNTTTQAGVTNETRYTYDGANNPLTQTVENGTTDLTTTYTYDRRGLQTSITDPRGGAAYKTNVAYNEAGQPILTTSPTVSVDVNGVATQNLALTAKASYDIHGNVVREARPDPGLAPTRYTYDAFDRPLSKTTPVTPGNCCGGSEVSESWTYDAVGNMLTHLDRRGKTTSFTYNKLDRLVRRTDPQVTGQPAAGFVKYEYDPQGNLTKTTDQRGAVVNATYDDMNRLVTQTQVERVPSTQNLTTTFAYDDLGNVTSVKDPLNNVTAAQYNAAGERTSQTDAANEVTTFTRDLAGRVTQETDPLGRKIVSAYDQAGRLTSVTDKDAANVTLRTFGYGYDAAGNQTSSTSPEGWTTTRTFDALNQLRSVVEPTTSTNSITTSFGYDHNGNRTFVTDGRGNTTWTTYNALDLPASTIEPSTSAFPALADRTWTYGYDTSGNRTQVVEPGPVTQNYVYDELGRMTSASGTGGAVATSKSIGYDLVGNITSIGVPGGTQTFTRNDRGAVTGQAGSEGSASFAYDAAGRLTSKTDAAGTTGYTYTSRNQLQTVVDPLTAQTFTYAYDDAQQLSSVTANGKVRALTRDGLGRVTSDVLTTGTTANNRTVNYGYDDNSNVTSQQIVFGGSTTQNNSYTYDRADRLTNWTQGSTSVAYSWDGPGNRTRNGGVTSTYNERNHLVSDSAGVTYTYTKRGTQATRTAGGTTNSFAFDSFDRLVYDSTDSGMSNPGLTYDALDRLFTRNGGTAFKYNGTGNADVVSDGSFSYVRTPDGTPVSASDGTTKRALLSNQHGDITGSYDVNGTNSTARVDYDPFGRKSNASGFTGNLGYQGSYNNPNSSAQRTNMWHRWYAPNQGIFLSRDAFDVPFVVGGDLNRHAYVSGNPLAYVDPTGQFQQRPPGIPSPSTPVRSPGGGTPVSAGQQLTRFGAGVASRVVRPVTRAVTRISPYAIVGYLLYEGGKQQLQTEMSVDLGNIQRMPHYGPAPGGGTSVGSPPGGRCAGCISPRSPAARPKSLPNPIPKPTPIPRWDVSQVPTGITHPDVNLTRPDDLVTTPTALVDVTQDAACQQIATCIVNEQQGNGNVDPASHDLFTTYIPEEGEECTSSSGYQSGAFTRGGGDSLGCTASGQADEVKGKKKYGFSREKTGKERIGAIPPTGLIDPGLVRFTQDSIKSRFKEGGSVEELADSLEEGRISATDIPAIRLVRYRGYLWTLDNRRLEAFRRAGIEVPYQMATDEEIQKEWKRKFTTNNDGFSIRLRMG